MSSEISLPYQGQRFESAEKKYQTVIVFTHWYGGNKHQLKKHIQLVNDLGFTAIAFNLFPQPFINSFQLLKKRSTYQSTLNHRWKKQCKHVLSLISEKKIIFSFSFSCNIISEICYQHPDIQALIFDGGPFASPIRNSWDYFSYQEVISNPIKRGLQVIPWNIFVRLFGLKRKINRSFNQLPNQFPILSFQGLNDFLVPPKCINQILKLNPRLNITTVSLPNTKHLNGIKTQNTLYKQSLDLFLSTYGSLY